MPATPMTLGKIVQIIGPVLDVEFDAGHLPELYNALSITGMSDAGDPIRVVVEVQQHIGRNLVRAVAMSSTDGVVRGMEVVDTGSAITVPVGEAALGRILNVIGSRWTTARRSRRRRALADPPQASRLREPRAQDRDLRDGDQVVDLIAPS